jgi:type I restriction enzyme, S subunit
MVDRVSRNGWRTFRFDEIAVMVNDRIDDPAEADVERYVGLEHLDSDSLKIRRWGVPTDVTATKLLFRKGDIILGRRRVYQRKLAVADFDGICSAHAMVLRSKPEVALSEFLPFFMQSDLFMERAKAISVGSLSPTINWKTLAKEKFDLPSLEEQRRLTHLLQACEEVRIRYQEAYSLSWKARISAYSSLTQRGIKSSGLRETPLGPAPSHWSVAPLQEVLVIENRLRKPINAADRSAMSGPFGYHGPTGKIDSLNEYRLEGTFSLIGEDGDHFLKYQIWSMTQLVTGRFNVNNHAHVLRGTERCLTEWFFHFYRHRDISQWLTKQGAARLKLKKATLEQMPILLPPIGEQEEIIGILERVTSTTEIIDERVKSAASLLRCFAT